MSNVKKNSVFDLSFVCFCIPLTVPKYHSATSSSVSLILCFTRLFTSSVGLSIYFAIIDLLDSASCFVLASLSLFAIFTLTDLVLTLTLTLTLTLI